MQDGQFPPGVCPYSFPFELGDLQELWSQSVLANKVVSVTVPKGSSVKGALRSIYHHSQKFNRETLLENWEAKLSRDKAQVKKDEIIKLIVDVVKASN